VPGCDAHAALERLQFCIVSVVGQIWRRLYLPYTTWPWRLASLLDDQLSGDTRLAIATSFTSSPICCMDEGFSLALRVMMDQRNYTADDMMPHGRLHGLLRATFANKNVNLEVETNFARASSQRQAMRGRRHSLASMATKHLLCESQLAHRRWQLQHSHPGDTLPPVGTFQGGDTIQRALEYDAGIDSPTSAIVLHEQDVPKAVKHTGWSRFLRSKLSASVHCLTTLCCAVLCLHVALWCFALLCTCIVSLVSLVTL